MGSGSYWARWAFVGHCYLWPVASPLLRAKASGKGHSAISYISYRPYIAVM